MAVMLGRSQHWASAKLHEWNREQEAGGPVRVSKTVTKNRVLLFTTIAILQREFVGAIRDSVLTKQVKDLEKDITFLTKRVDELTASVYSLNNVVYGPSHPKRAS